VRRHGLGLSGLSGLSGLGALDDAGPAAAARRASTTAPGLYYVGLSGQRNFASATLRGVGPDAVVVVELLLRRHRRR